MSNRLLLPRRHQSVHHKPAKRARVARHVALDIEALQFARPYPVKRTVL